MKTLYTMWMSTICLTLAACGNRDTGHSSRLLFNLPSTRPLVIGMSGYSTCTESEDYHNGESGPLGAQIFRKVEMVVQRISEKINVEPAVLASCFTDNSELITASSLDGWVLKQPKDGDYLASIREQIDFFTHVFVVGHSYGGWLAMKLAESYRGTPDKIKTLHTIDPISKELCYFNNVSECLSAPRDIGKPSREHIRDHTETWVNAWQDVTFFLHSSSIAEADENPKYDEEHWDIDNNDELWEKIHQQIAITL